MYQIGDSDYATKYSHFLECYPNLPRNDWEESGWPIASRF